MLLMAKVWSPLEEGERGGGGIRERGGIKEAEREKEKRGREREREEEKEREIKEERGS